MRPKSARRTIVAATTLLILATLTACKSENIFFRVTNKSGGVLHDVKVTYPGDEFIVPTLQGSSNTFSVFGVYRHFSGPGDLTVSYSTDSGRSYSHSGPTVTGSETGEVAVNIDGSDATFETKFDVSQK
jgi:hypothetical protein